MSKVDVYAYLIHDKTEKKLGLSIPRKPYQGNLLSDFISERTHLMNVEKKVAGDKFLQLILNIYRHTIAEKRSDFIYFAFWNILETIARFKEYDIGKNPDGTIKFNTKGKPVKLGAERMVLELINNIYQSKNRNPEFNVNNKTYSVLEMTTMWYQHRNCTAHKGGCNFSNLTQCDTTKTKIMKCRNCTAGVSPLEADLYISTIRRVSWEIVTQLLYN